MKINPKLAIQEDFDLSPLSESAIGSPMDYTGSAGSNWILRRTKSKESVDSAKFCLTETEFSDWTENSLAGDAHSELGVLDALDVDYSETSKLPPKLPPPSSYLSEKKKPVVELAPVVVDIPIFDDLKFADDGTGVTDTPPQLPSVGPPDSPTSLSPVIIVLISYFNGYGKINLQLFRWCKKIELWEMNGIRFHDIWFVIVWLNLY